jgi:hypothetical protein
MGSEKSSIFMLIPRIDGDAIENEPIKANMMM